MRRLEWTLLLLADYRSARSGGGWLGVWANCHTSKLGLLPQLRWACDLCGLECSFCGWERLGRNLWRFKAIFSTMGLGRRVVVVARMLSLLIMRRTALLSAATTRKPLQRGIGRFSPPVLSGAD